jgi:hypothetical protein
MTGGIAPGGVVVSLIETATPVTFFTLRVGHGGFHASGCAAAATAPKSMTANNATSERRIRPVMDQISSRYMIETDKSAAVGPLAGDMGRPLSHKEEPSIRKWTSATKFFVEQTTKVSR